MKKANTKNKNNLALSDIFEKIHDIDQKQNFLEKENIKNNSPYSKEITRSISKYEELQRYCNIGLMEAAVTRLSLIREINLDLWVSSKKKTNRELMLAGKQPYAFDAPKGAIELHHIGQNYDAPFAELTHEEHQLCGNNKNFSRKNALHIGGNAQKAMFEY